MSNKRLIFDSIENIVRGQGDNTSNICNFIERLNNPIKSNGIDKTEDIYDIPKYILEKIEKEYG